MKKRLIVSLLGLSILILSATPASASFGPIATTGDIANLQAQLNNLSSELTAIQSTVSSNQVFGSTNATQPVAGTNYSLAGSGVSASAGSIVLTSFTVTQTGAKITSSMLSTNFYITLEPGNTARQEIASCTGVTQNANGTATLSNCSRGLLPFQPYTASSSYAFPHGGGTTVILSNPPQLYNELAALGNTESITGLWTFASGSVPLYSAAPTFTNPLQIIDKAYVDGVASSGAPDAGIGSKGLVAVTTPGGAATSTDGSQVLYNFIGKQYYASSSQGATTTAVLTTPSGTISSSFIATSSNYVWGGNNTSTGNYSFVGTTTIGGTNVTSTSFSKFGGTGTDGAFSLSGGATSSINVGAVNVFIKNYSSISITGTSSLAFTNGATNGTVVILKSTGNCTLTSATTTMIDVTQIGAASGNPGYGLSGGPGIGYTIGGSFSQPGPSTESVSLAVVGRGEHVAPSSTSLYAVFAGAAGTSGNWSNAAVNGAGGGGLIIECGGSLNFTGTISANGNNGVNGSGAGSGYGSVCGALGGASNADGGGASCTSNGSGNAGGGGGGAGSIWIGYNGALVAQSGTMNVTGGTGGTGTAGGGAGANGFSFVGKNTEY